MIVLDASALLAFLFREPGHEKVAPLLDESLISTVNLAEVLSRFARDGHDPRPVAARLARAGIARVPFTERLATIAAAILPLVAARRLSLGDRACLALAMSRDLPAVTADRHWAMLDLPIPVQLIR
jgi:ribonuclease VapC